MKKTILFAVSVSAVLLAGCLPQGKLTGRVVDQDGPVPGAAVLAMVWVEDGSKSMPVPDISNLDQEALDKALEKDMRDRGLPMAYARTFTGEQGAFVLDKFYFSAETKKAVKAMTQPKITRITLNAFQRGYLKHAATRFPKGMDMELSPAVVTLSKPESWKQLALDNYFRLLRRDEYDQGYSKHFGATREEKKWFLDYMTGNLNDAYQVSNIKGDKQWVEDCGHDFSDILVSSAGIQYNSALEKCNLLLRQAGVLRDWEELWLTHAYSPVDGQSPAVSAVKEAIDGLGPEYAEVKQYEGKILEGVAEAEKAYRKSGAPGDLRNGLKEEGPVPGKTAQMYNDGDKVGSYKALGYSLFQLLLGDLKQGTVTAMLPVTVVPKIRETAGGFYLLMNRPLTAQLPGGDGGNHGDKPEIRKSSETNKGQDSRIVVAERELVVLRDGTEVRRELVSEGSEKARRVYAEAKAKNLQIKAHALKEPKLLFYDKQGELAKELSLGRKDHKIVRKKHALLKSEKPIQQTPKAEAWVSENGKRALYVESVTEYELEEDEKTRKLNLGTTSNCKYYSSGGQVLFVKQLSSAYSVWRAALSEDGRVVVVVKSCEMPDWECPGPGEEEDSLIVYDETGKKLMGQRSALTNLVLSPNGKYLSACRGDEIFFFNTENKNVWKTESELAVRKIDNSGKARLSKSQGEGKKPIRIDIDLTKYLGD
jgi:hypothetical protein